VSATLARMGAPVIVSYARTAVADARRGALANTSIYELGKAVVSESLKRSGVAAEDIEDLVMGEVLHGGGNLARYIAIELGLTDVPGLANMRACASGLQAINTAAADIKSDMTSAAIAGGMESMTQTPLVYRASPQPWGGITPWMSDSHAETPDAPNRRMGITVGENTAEKCGISRTQQDEWSLASHQRAVAAIDAGYFKDEIVPIELQDRKGNVTVFDTDEHPRRDTSLEKLAALQPLFKPGGTVTAGNSSSLNDGAAAVVLADQAYADAHGLPVLGIVRSWASVGVPPRDTGLAPSLAIPKACRLAGIEVGDLKLAEINEAFASMAVACTQLLGLSHDQVNVNGGAVGLGHPVAASGARILGTLIMELRRRGGGYGVASLCAGGGMGTATVVEVPAS
jgi:acetyl-CoA acetyltransferase family protein